MKFALGLLVLLIAALFISYWLSPLHTFNTLVPKDGGARKVAASVAFGDDARQALDIYAPANAEGGALPVIVFFYGGSWDSGTRHGYDFAGRALAAQGFVVVIPDYRLVPNVHYPAFVEDGASAVRWVQANIADYGGDASRLVLSGHSAGAYIGAMLAYDDRWLGDARSAVRGFAGLAGPYDFLPLDTAASRAAFGEWPRLEETQPISWVEAGAPPALILTGADDTTVKAHNGRSLAERLTDRDVVAQEVEYAGVDHIDILIAMARPLRGRAPVLHDVAQFARNVAGSSD
ncbi:alpha/beta hydrolase [Aurantiacibacter sp. MUD11]|uniref:alpha/beta hydrolase n=1 Tax=Aurantiacibacter sp. MUD11 TaxID=3003265 RepID=UPI0022AA219F|nr:alpha/beta hydrolase [Aurantiacibacter sp. MUD11]WAT17756.1 alpha/beta hydrolase [Aurantiacibacter sp. MUD11]